MEISSIFCVDPSTKRVLDQSVIGRVIPDIRAYHGKWAAQYDEFDAYVRTNVFLAFILDLNGLGPKTTLTATLRMISRRVAVRFGTDNDLMPYTSVSEIHARSVGLIGEIALVAPSPHTATEFVDGWMKFVSQPGGYQAGLGAQLPDEDPYQKFKGLYDPYELTGFRELREPLEAMLTTWAVDGR